MTHLAIGDFVYQRVYLQALKRQYPHLKIDIWIDDCRRKRQYWHRERNNSLGQWLNSEPYLNFVYSNAESAEHRIDLQHQAQQKNYDLVFFIATQRGHDYARVAKEIGTNAKVIGACSVSKASRFLTAMNMSPFAKLDGYFLISKKQRREQTIGNLYAQWFSQCLPLQLPDQHSEQDFQIPLPLAPTKMLEKEINHIQALAGGIPKRIIFINHLSTSVKRNMRWTTLETVVNHLQRANPEMFFVISLPPGRLTEFSEKLRNSNQINQQQIMPFSATDNFFKLPAMIQFCDLIISVETAAMHLAEALHKPQLVLMRKSALSWQPERAKGVLLGRRQVDDISARKIVDKAQQLLDTVFFAAKN